MVRHNNMIPNGHFHKKYQCRIKTWFDQPMQKKRRNTLRAKKLRQAAPKPIQYLRPVVNCPSARYNSKMRVGRGFTLQELRKAKINKNVAKTIGIAVDPRRKNRCMESLQRNVQRLKEYKNRIILFPLKEKIVQKFDNGKKLNQVKAPENKLKVRKISEEDRKFEAYVTLRKARCDEKYTGLRMKKKLPKFEAQF